MLNFIKKIQKNRTREWYVEKLKNGPFLFLYKIKSFIKFYLIKFDLNSKKITRINLCSGSILFDNYCNIDIYWGADLFIDLEKKLLPFSTNSIDVVVCTSAINYFTRERGEKIIHEVFRILKPGGIARFSTQDLESITSKYVNKDMGFFFQKLPNGQERFIGETMCDKLNSWFYGYAVAKNKGCKYFYDFETLSSIFKKVGFNKIENKQYLDSKIEDIEKIDNRPDQMFFLEAVK